MGESRVYLYGMTLMTTSYRLASGFPAAGTYGEIDDGHRLPGGETGTCAVVLASLGLDVQVDGNHLGRNTYPQLTSFFQSRRVSLDLMTYDADFDGLEDIVFIDQQSRTAFGRFGAFFASDAPPRWNRPDEKAIQQAQVAGLDPFFLEESVEAARLCRKHKVRYVTVDCPADSEIHRLAAVSILSEEFLRGRYPEKQPESLFAEYASGHDGLIIFTFGEKSLWFGRDGQAAQRLASYQVAAESTLGAGDSFKAGVIYALARGMGDSTLVRFAAATAAAACMRYPIALYPPTRARIAEVAGQSFGLGDAWAL